MGNDNYRKVSEYFQPKYDSDQDLTPEERTKIRDSSSPSKTRKELWDKQGVYPKLKKTLKTAWDGDKRAIPDDEND